MSRGEYEHTVLVMVKAQVPLSTSISLIPRYKLEVRKKGGNVLEDGDTYYMLGMSFVNQSDFTSALPFFNACT